MTILVAIRRHCLTFSTAIIFARAFSTSLCLYTLSSRDSRLQSSGFVQDGPTVSYSCVEEVDSKGGEELRNGYLERIGFSSNEAAALVDRGPNLDDLQQLLYAHLLTVPFENMDQHSHPAHEETVAIPRRRQDSLPSLDVHRSLKKIVRHNRGGFCFELNFSFAWLLRSLGYSVRLALADVGCSQAVPAHVVVLVDGLSKNEPLLVDVGFGNPGVCEEVLPLVYNEPAEVRGDLFRFVIDQDTARFNTALYRTRVTAPHVEEPMYRFHSRDDLSFDAPEFENGLDMVLTTSEFFTTKRICVLSTDRGHVTLGKDYIKWVERGETVQREELPTETEWRSKLA